MTMRKVLVIAHQFPPFADGGVVRIHSFVKHLPAHGWQPLVLTVEDRYYPGLMRDENLVNQLQDDVKIFRTESLAPHGRLMDSLTERVYGTRMNASFFEKFLKPVLRKIYRSVIFPDEKILWLPHAIRAGRRLSRELDPDVILATTPPHSGGIIAAILSLITGTPFVLDVRDDWVGNPLFFQSFPWHYRLFARIAEKFIIRRARQVISVTPESVALFRSKYPDDQPDKFRLISNGYDREDLESAMPDHTVKKSEKLRLIYIGGLPLKRSPLAFFAALSSLNADLQLESRLQVDFFGSVREDYVLAADDMGLKSIVHFHGFVPRGESLRQLALSDAGLLIIPEEEGSQTAIPGKVYEYLGARKYVLALCPENSATSRLVNELNLGLCVPHNQVEAIRQAIMQTLARYEDHRLQVAFDPKTHQRFDRFHQVKELAHLLDTAVSLG